MSDDDASRSSRALAWSGDEHKLKKEAAHEAGLPASEVEVDLYVDGFKRGITVEDPYDGAIVARGRTVLSEAELLKSLIGTMRYLGLARDEIKARIHDGTFELRVHRGAADRSGPLLDSAKNALRVWIGFGLLGFAALQFLPQFVALIAWSAGLLLGGWQLRKGLASGRAMLAARLALALAMLAQSEQLILPPAHGDASPS